MKKTIAQQLNVKQFPFIIRDSNDNKLLYWEDSEGLWYKMEYDSEGNHIYFETSNGFWYKYEYDSDGNQIYYECSDGTIIDYRNTPEEKSKEESPEETLLRLIKDKVVLEFCQDFGCTSSEATVEIVLNGRIMTDEYYSELMEVINKLQHRIQFTVIIGNK